jgi:hypothetical protein
MPKYGESLTLLEMVSIFADQLTLGVFIFSLCPPEEVAI